MAGPRERPSWRILSSSSSSTVVHPTLTLQITISSRPNGGGRDRIPAHPATKVGIMSGFCHQGIKTIIMQIIEEEQGQEEYQKDELDQIKWAHKCVHNDTIIPGYPVLASPPP